ncbi:hypothetical protein O3M35_006934 [Rhynocoris fuscipes]|uniref:Transmembrane protein n=1 Tax=Rhynocoris fuscipes TaxID=488301 RepID=A0AAW1DFT4_9HEMI
MKYTSLSITPYELLTSKKHWPVSISLLLFVVIPVVVVVVVEDGEDNDDDGATRVLEIYFIVIIIMMLFRLLIHPLVTSVAEPQSPHRISPQAPHTTPLLVLHTQSTCPTIHFV